MAAGEDQLESLVLDHDVGLGFWIHGGGGDLELSSLDRERPLPADAVDGPIAGGDREPGARVGGHALTGPALGGGGECLLGGLLGEVEVAEEADQRGQDPAPLLAEDLIQRQGS
jgi:hypothetical protein